jgi:hypothetical protein
MSIAKTFVHVLVSQFKDICVKMSIAFKIFSAQQSDVCEKCKYFAVVCICLGNCN